ncbi:peptide ABC transporter substrate-binding protein [Tepidibacter aestuarii]|uniref:peptide ABC transporter substrate-binding protein n=1 Tax=Tepidibacter aestuarii TaxID=2925782 RepID=UPI002ED567C1|nr:oligopeptide transport system substrate-binding protein [Tepidibacter aestuarii]
MKKVLSFMMILVLALGTLAGCGGGTEQAGEAKKTVKYNLGSDPKTLDPALNAEVQGSTILVNCYEGLMRLDENNKPIPGMAESYDVSDDNLTYTFHLRDANWSDGQKVTAQDFEYAWKRALDPKTAAEYAYQLYYIQNGNEFNANKASIDDVAVKALDEKTLEVTLIAPTPYFLELTAFPTYFPVRKDIVEKNPEAWPITPENVPFNGPFKMTKWERNNVVEIVKNDNYYDADRVKLDGVEFTMITEATTAFQAFESGEIDGADEVPEPQIPQLRENNDPSFKIHPYIGIYYYALNVTKEPTNDPKVREALSLAIDRNLITTVVVKAGQKPAKTFVPEGMKGPDGKDFTENAKDYGITPEAQVEKAQKLLAEAGYPNGEGFPETTVYYNTNENHKAIAEAVQEMWKKNLNINVNLQNQEWKVFQETRTQGNFQIARDGWIGDYLEPMTFLDMFISTSGNNHPQWKNPEFDKLITDIKKTQDLDQRYKMLHQAEDMVMDENIVIPIYYYTNPELLKENIKGVTVSPFGQVYFDSANIE